MFPDLTLQSGGVHVAANTGTPANGVNTFAHNIPEIDDTSRVDVTVIANGNSITAASLVSVTNTQVSINFTQTGADTATVVARLEHTTIR